MPKCTFLIGVPGSGKSTWLNMSSLWNSESIIVSTDNIIEDIASEYNITYNDAFPDLIKFAEKAMWNSLEDAVQYGDSVVIDRTNLTAGSRKRFIKFLQGYEFEAVVFPTPDPVEWERRLNSRPGKTIPENVLKSMVRNFEAPTEQEGFSSITYINP